MAESNSFWKHPRSARNTAIQNPFASEVTMPRWGFKVENDNCDFRTCVDMREEKADFPTLGNPTSPTFRNDFSLQQKLQLLRGLAGLRVFGRCIVLVA